MSFILDALKKAEAERQRQTGPTLLEVRVTAPRRRFPLWSMIIGGLLAINMLLLVIFALRRPAISAPQSMPAAAVAAPAAAPVAAPPAAALPAAVVPAAPVPAAPPVASPVASPIAAAAASAADTSANPLAGPVANAADLEPALPARNADADDTQEPPSLSEISGEMPDLRLDLQVYAARPANRYALINMHRVHEGDVLPEGPRVLAIERDGVKLSYRGTEFMLRPQ
jgi:general secretion pathway protein B